GGRAGAACALAPRRGGRGSGGPADDLGRGRRRGAADGRRRGAGRAAQSLAGGGGRAARRRTGRGGSRGPTQDFTGNGRPGGSRPIGRVIPGWTLHRRTPAGTGRGVGAG